MMISIVIPIYNEKNTILKLLKKIEHVNLGDLKKEVIIVDDYSTDGTRDILGSLEKEKYKIVLKSKNEGKGSALREGFNYVTGDIVLIQDADLEYDPKEYPLLIQPILDGDADVVFGSRFISVFPRRVLYFSHYIANQLLTFLSNVFTGINLSDMETCYKVFSRKAIQEILPCLRSSRFGIEPELTAQVSKHKLRIYEVGISYRGRTYEEGKKINWRDGLAALWHIFRFNLLTRK